MSIFERQLPTRRDVLQYLLVGATGITSACEGSGVAERSPSPVISSQAPEITPIAITPLEEVLGQPGSYYNGNTIHLGKVPRDQITLASKITTTGGDHGAMTTYEMPYTSIDQSGNKQNKDASHAFVGGFLSRPGHGFLLWFVDVNPSKTNQSEEVNKDMEFKQKGLLQQTETDITGKIVTINDLKYRANYGNYA